MEPSCCYPENLGKTVIVICLLIVFLLSVWANSTLFIEKYLVSLGKIDRVSCLLKSRGIQGFRNLNALLCFTWRYERSLFLEALIVFVVLEFCLVVMVMSALASAAAFINLLKS